ncbi:MAG: hypothetical protein IPK19_09900 [Chloroflexi bacterium]|nr:hypothetical protein [Chloroflexota bacterium]
MASSLGRVAVLLTAGALVLMLLFMGAGTLALGDPDLIMAQNNCDLPCAFGVTPGLTDRQTAESTYQQMAVKPASFLTATHFSYTLRIGTHTADAAGMAASSADTDADPLALALVRFQQTPTLGVRSVGIYEMPPARLWRVGDLLLKMPPPSRVFASCEAGNSRLLLVFGQDIIAEIAPEKQTYAFSGETVIPRLTPDMKINRLAVTADLEFTLNDLLASTSCAVESPWRGFAAYWSYETQGRGMPEGE